MGWTTRTNLRLTPEQIEQVLTAIHAAGLHTPTWTRTEWGWSSECDITVDRSGHIMFSGAWFSYDCDLPKRFRAECRRLGIGKKEI